jgi:hypothetical protein
MICSKESNLWSGRASAVAVAAQPWLPLQIRHSRAGNRVQSTNTRQSDIVAFSNGQGPPRTIYINLFFPSAFSWCLQVLISSSAELPFIKDAYSSAVNSYFEQNHWMSQGTVRPFMCYCTPSPNSAIDQGDVQSHDANRGLDCELQYHLPRSKI